MNNDRKIGQRKTDLSGETDAEVIKKAKSLVRTDFGGASDPLAAIGKKMQEKGITTGPQSQQAIKELLEEQVESCRKRVFPRLDESIRRAEKRGAAETLP